MLAVSRLTLTDFRCYSFLRMTCETRPVVLTGPNGAGKTNLLEALSFLAPGRGLRRAKLSDVTRRPAGETWAVAAVVERGSDRQEIGTGCYAGSERRLVRIDGQAVRSQAVLSEVMSVLWLTPAMDRLFTEGASGRRRFLDRLVLGFHPGHAAHAGTYDRALRERARLLRDGCRDTAWLASLEEIMVTHGLAMAQARRATVIRLNEACCRGIGPFPAARLDVAGEVEERLDGSAEAWFRDSLAASRWRDSEGTPGPHRSDLAVRQASRDMPAASCSTGEQKAILVAIVLGQARLQASERGWTPILLLDEIAAHLDRERRAALFDELCALGAQSWLTGTDEELFTELGERGQFFRVDDSIVTRVR